MAIPRLGPSIGNDYNLLKLYLQTLRIAFNPLSHCLRVGFVCVELRPSSQHTQRLGIAVKEGILDTITILSVVRGSFQIMKGRRLLSRF